MTDAVLIRYGEVFLKKGNRRSFLGRLQGNLVKKVKDFEDIEVGGPHGRFLVFRRDRRPMDADMAVRVTAAVATTFGVTSVSPVVMADPTLEAIIERGRRVADMYLDEHPVETFRVTATRPWKRHPFGSMEVQRELGAAVVRDHGLKVDLTRAQMDIGVEVHQNKAWFYVDRTQGPGGLPVGSSGTGVVLLSGGIDSPVAAWMMAKRGVSLEAVYFHSFPYTSEQARRKVEDLARILARWHGPMNLRVVPFTAVQEYLRDRTPPALLVLLYRRAMIRIALRLAAEVKGGALITGESLAQVASQTMQNLAVIEDASTLPILRPLVGFDKQETMDKAIILGTYEVSIRPHIDCCSLFAPGHPETKAKVERIREVEAPLEELDRLLDEAVANTEIVEITD
ncbi:MAG: tRNA uracil 4-sulfurtransferase ThiI [Pseudomonadota bacterium]